MKTQLSAILMAFAGVANTYAGSNFAIGDISVQGNACQSASDVSIVLSPDNTEASILFGSFSAEVGANSQNPDLKRDLKNCTIRVPIQLESGFALQSYTADVRGFTQVDKGATSRIHSASKLWVPQHGRYVSGFHKNKILATFRGPASEDFTLSDVTNLPKGAETSSCGRPVYLDLSMAVDVQTNKKSGAFATMMIDSLDLGAQAKGAIDLGIKFKRCY